MAATVTQGSETHLPRQTWAFKVKYFINGYLCLTSIPSHVKGLFFLVFCSSFKLPSSHSAISFMFFFFFFINLTAFFDFFDFVTMFLLIYGLMVIVCVHSITYSWIFFYCFCSIFICRVSLVCIIIWVNSGCTNSVFRVSCG